MKKLKLKLDGKEMLSKAQMKKISGGYKACWVFFFDKDPMLQPCPNQDQDECNCQELMDALCRIDSDGCDYADCDCHTDG